MCDYSRHGLPSRLAYEGELLVTYRFATESVGLTAALDLEDAWHRKTNMSLPVARFFALRRRRARIADVRQVPAVCIPPGARLRMTHIPSELKRRWALRPVEDVWFTETSEDLERFRDAIRFGNGRRTLLQSLPEGICFLVLSLGGGSGSKERQTPTWPADFAPIGLLRARQQGAP